MNTGAAESQSGRVPGALAAELYRQAAAEGLGLSLPQFHAALERAVHKSLDSQAGDSPAGDSPADGAAIESFCRGLRLEEAALAAACAEGVPAAWDLFMRRYRPTLYSAARAIAKEESQARELADSIYAELYGMRGREGKRISKLLSYTGRGSLDGWLRTVVAQEFINQYRKTKRLVSLEEETEAGMQLASPAPILAAGPPHGDLAQLAGATDAALKELSPEDKFILAAYFLDDRTLAGIGRMLGMHESTVSRKLEKISRNLRKRILASLVRLGMSPRRAEEAIEADVRDLAVNVRISLGRDGAASANAAQDQEGQPFPVMKEKQP